MQTRSCLPATAWTRPDARLVARFFALCIAPALLSLSPGCAGAAKDTSSTDSTVGTGAAAYCAETGRSTVADPSTIADGFTFAPADAIANFAHAWGGSWQTYSGGSLGAGAALSWTNGTIDAVRYAMSGDTGSMGSGADSSACTPRYEIGVALIVDTDDRALAESVDSVTLLAAAVDAASFDTRIDLANVGGNTRPTWNTADWATNTLALDGSGDPTTLTISATWQASSASASPKDSGGSSSTDTGTVSASGMTEGVGSMTLTPAS